EVGKGEGTHPWVGDAGGKGLMVCLERVRDRKTQAPLVPPNTDSLLPMQVRNYAWELGIHIQVRGSLILLSPPLIIQPEHIDEGLTQLDKVLTWVEQTERIG